MTNEQQPGALGHPPAAACPPSIPDYELVRRIGHGNYGDVWLGRSLTGVWRAVKVVCQGEGEAGKAFEHEFRGIQFYEPISQSDESLMAVLHVGRNERERFFYYVMELADDAGAGRGDGVEERWSAGGGVREKVGEWVGGTSKATAFHETPHALAQTRVFDPAAYVPRTLRHEVARRGRLPFKECVALGLALTSAVKALHTRGRLHRDIKPSNIIFVNGRPKLADIGLVTRMDATLSQVGTIGYAAPEGICSGRCPGLWKRSAWTKAIRSAKICTGAGLGRFCGNGRRCWPWACTTGRSITRS